MDVSKSTLLAAALVAGFLVGFLTQSTNAEATHQNLYQAVMMPPTHPTGQLSYNSCGWHTGSCYANQNGAALDWGHNNYVNPNDNTARFRGWLYRSGTSYSSSYLLLVVYKPAGGSTVCDDVAADVVEILPWRTRYGMHFLHTTNTVAGGLALYVSGSGIGALNSRTVATMIPDGGCPWDALHAHTSLAQAALTYYQENRTIYPCCNYGGQNYPNNNESYRTHTVQFQQGH